MIVGEGELASQQFEKKNPATPYIPFTQVLFAPFLLMVVLFRRSILIQFHASTFQARVFAVITLQSFITASKTCPSLRILGETDGWFCDGGICGEVLGVGEVGELEVVMRIWSHKD